ncbi:hypothetical protein [Tateyamaria pelophila]|uniref:hypothetical protein n=1 Tax=Tateyamaria pelophila TaxID=328415 RepID=UPI001CBF19DF|nr:hypothetical protein [Tateyamaria pelophila]
MTHSSSDIVDDLVQLGRPARVRGRHVNMPLELGATIVFDTLVEFEAAYYGRYSDAATFKLGRMLAHLEQGGHESLALPVTPKRSADTWTEDRRLVHFNIGLEELDILVAGLTPALPHLKTASE